MLLLDIPLAAAACDDRAELRRRDRWLRLGVPATYAAWLEGPLRRHCPQLGAVEFHWELETRGPVPGSLAARTKRQMPRAALAEQAGVPLQTVQEVERGYPVTAEVAAAICRNLDLPGPDLESSPVIRLALLLKQRRGQARLSRAQVAQRAGLPSQVLRALETASQWPSQQVCLALLSVQALGLRESDVAAFLSVPAPETPDPERPRAPMPGPAASSPQESPEPSAPPRRPRGRPPGTHGGRPFHSVPSPVGNQVVAAFLIRFYASGKVSIEMRPTRPRTRRKVGAEEAPRDGAQESRVPPAR